MTFCADLVTLKRIGREVEVEVGSCVQSEMGREKRIDSVEKKKERGIEEGK